MATAALPIRGLSANVKVVAASANKTFWDVVETRQRREPMLRALWAACVHYLIHKLDRKLARLIARERELIARLEALSLDALSDGDFLAIAEDIQGIISLTNSLVEEAYSMPDICLSTWRPTLRELEAATSHLDNFVESFRMAADDACTALLADMARQIA